MHSSVFISVRCCTLILQTYGAGRHYDQGLLFNTKDRISKYFLKACITTVFVGGNKMGGIK